LNLNIFNATSYSRFSKKVNNLDNGYAHALSPASTGKTFSLEKMQCAMWRRTKYLPFENIIAQ